MTSPDYVDPAHAVAEKGTIARDGYILKCKLCGTKSETQTTWVQHVSGKKHVAAARAKGVSPHGFDMHDGKGGNSNKSGGAAASSSGGNGADKAAAANAAAAGGDKGGKWGSAIPKPRSSHSPEEDDAPKNVADLLRAAQEKKQQAKQQAPQPKPNAWANKEHSFAKPDTAAPSSSKHHQQRDEPAQQQPVRILQRKDGAAASPTKDSIGTPVTEEADDEERWSQFMSGGLKKSSSATTPTTAGAPTLKGMSRQPSTQIELAATAVVPSSMRETLPPAVGVPRIDPSLHRTTDRSIAWVKNHTAINIDTTDGTAKAAYRVPHSLYLIMTAEDPKDKLQQAIHAGWVAIKAALMDKSQDRDGAIDVITVHGTIEAVRDCEAFILSMLQFAPYDDSPPDVGRTTARIQAESFW